MKNEMIVQKKCKSCGKSLDEKWRFCPYCKNKRSSGNRDEILDGGNDWLKEILEN